MAIQDKIRTLREINNLTQEQMAGELQISKNSYAKIERGESKLKIERLEQIANIFKIDVADLVSSAERGLVLLIGGDECNHSGNYYANAESLLLENKTLKITIDHQKQLLAQKEEKIQILNAAKEKEIELLKKLVETLEKR